MKRNFLIMSVLASMFLVGCSQEVITQNGETDGNGETKTSYLSVMLKSADTSTSRADQTYEYGTADENKVAKVRFYFFTNTDDPANVKLIDGIYVNYYDWYPEANAQTANGNTNVGSKLKATLVIETPKGDKLPNQIVAVINPIETEPQSRSLSYLRSLKGNYATGKYIKAPTGTVENNNVTGGFLMFNSVYAQDQDEICAVPIGDKLKTDKEEATSDPVVIYVERCVAKVSVNFGPDVTVTGDNKLALKDKNNEDLTIGDKQVYLKINGWKLASETSSSRLVKKIDLNWSIVVGLKDWWNNSTNRRSCWAINASNATNTYYNYNEINTSFDNKLYTNENAADYINNNEPTGLYKTKVILSGTLGVVEEADGSFSPLTIVRHLGAHFADTPGTKDATGKIVSEENNLPALKKSILTQLTNQQAYYWHDDDQNIYIPIQENDLKIVLVGPNGVEDGDNAQDCYVYAQLTEDAEKKTWYTTDTEGATAVAEGSKVINTALENNVDKALVWNSGMTYYYYEIIHNNDPKVTGVVRNHVYKTTVTKIAGLGTPVYDPTEKIYPEKPKDNDHYIAAQINILAWHIVSNDYELEW